MLQNLKLHSLNNNVEVSYLTIEIFHKVHHDVEDELETYQTFEIR